MLFPSEQKISITAIEMSSVQLTRQETPLAGFTIIDLTELFDLCQFLPVCVKGFGHSSSGNVEPLL